MKFKFTKNWNSQKAGETHPLPNQLANMLQSQGYGEIVKPEVKKTETEPISQAKGSPNEKPKSKSKRS